MARLFRVSNAGQSTWFCTVGTLCPRGYVHVLRPCAVKGRSQTMLRPRSNRVADWRIRFERDFTADSYRTRT